MDPQHCLLEKDSLSFLFYFYLVLIWKRWTSAVPACASHTPSPAPSIHTTALQQKKLYVSKIVWILKLHWLNMDLDLQSLLGLHVTLCAQLYSLAESPHTPPPPNLGSYTTTLLVSR
jgi:hypothetical protein